MVGDQLVCKAFWMSRMHTWYVMDPVKYKTRIQACRTGGQRVWLFSMSTSEALKRSVGLMVLLMSQLAVCAAVVTYTAPEQEPRSSDYEVWAGGQKVDVYAARTLDAPFAGKEWDFGGNYSFANFDTSGEVEVRIKARCSLDKLVIRPEGKGVKQRREGANTVVLTLPGPRKLSLEPDGKRGPLLLFANPVEESTPKAGDPGVVYYGPGVHKAGRIALGSNQTLYLAGGAVVKGGIEAFGENIRIRGRGILDSSDYEWRKGPTPFVVSLCGTNLEVSGITIRGASHWTIVPRNSSNVVVRGVKLCNARVQNDDGINPCNSRHVLITDCFIRTDDDCVAMKGLDNSLANNNVEDVTVENCVLWCDRARIFLLGHESRAPYMRSITLRNLDIIHFTMTAFLFEPGEEMRLENVTVEDVRIHGEGQGELVRLRPVVNQYMDKKVPGHVQNVRFSRLGVSGQPGPYRIQLEGADADHQVKDVVLDQITRTGENLRPDAQYFEVGKHVQGVTLDKQKVR